MPKPEPWDLQPWEEGYVDPYEDETWEEQERREHEEEWQAYHAQQDEAAAARNAIPQLPPAPSVTFSKARPRDKIHMLMKPYSSLGVVDTIVSFIMCAAVPVVGIFVFAALLKLILILKAW